MFEGIKKKLSNFVNSITKKEEERIEKEEATITTIGTQQKVEELVEKPSFEKAKVIEEKVQAQIPQEKEKEKAKVSVGTKLKGILLREVKVSQGDIEPFIEQLKYALLQSDVNYEACEKIINNIQKNLVARPIKSMNIEEEITDIIRNSILEILNRGSDIDLVKVASEGKGKGAIPFKILFVGPNGAGKTTTMAKVAHMLKESGMSCVMSASDTFRAAAIEQTVYHANKLGINVIKGAYGADPASVAFDAIAHAKAHHIDVVLIDSAGRQETNKSLMEEVKKIVRIAKPDLKIFVGEGIAGNTLLNQVREFKDAVGLDGVILTKLDCDAKGGNTLSVLSETSVPVLYFGIGERYSDLKKYEPEFIINNII